MLVVQDFKNSTYSGNTSQWLLANAPRANIGFLSNAEVQQSENLWQEGVIYEKKKLKLKNRKMAVTRTYAVNDLLVMLLCSYPKQEKLSSNGEEFLNSLIIK